MSLFIRIALSASIVVMATQSLRSDEPAATATPLPAGAIARFGSSRFLNFGQVFSVAFSPDGKTLAAGSWDGAIRIWEIASGKELHQFQREKAPIRTVAFSPDGKLLACGGERSGIVLWETATGKEVKRLTGHHGPITFVAFSPDGKRLASGAYDDTFRLWDVDNRREVRRFGSRDVPKQGHDSECPISFALDGKTVASATLAQGALGSRVQRTFRVWEVETGAEIRSFKDDNAWHGAASFTPDGARVAVASGRVPGAPPRISLWDVETGKALHPIEPTPEEHAGSWSFLAFSPDGKILATCSSGPIQLWEVATRREVCRFSVQDTGPACLAFSPDGRRLASGSTDITVLLWDVTGRMHNGKLDPAKLSAKECQAFWEDLGSADVLKARSALWALVAAGNDGIAFLRSCLHPATSPASAETIAKLIADLDSQQYAVRSRARTQLAQLADLAEPALLAAQKNQPSLEMRQRTDELLKLIVDLRSRPSGERLRAWRAVEVLEQIKTTEARQLLQTLSRGAPGALLTREAQASLKRLERS